MPITKFCEVCGKSVTREPSRFLNHIYCSQECWAESLRKTITKPCENCGRPVTRAPCHFENKHIYCSHECHLQSQRCQITRPCEICGKLITRPRSHFKEHAYCSRECYYESKRIQKTKACEICGKLITRPPCNIREHVYCSSECFQKTRRGIISKITKQCEWCGCEFDVWPYRGKTARFCSFQCMGAWTVRHCRKRDTDIELLTAIILDDLNLVYEPQKQIDRFLCDFFLVDHNLVIECDGVYWHQLPGKKTKDANRDERLVQLGYRILRLPGDKIRKLPEWCRDQIMLMVRN